MVATPTLQKQLETQGFRNIVRWTRGVDVELCKPSGKGFLELPRPIFVYLGRVAVEKNIEAFLDLDLPGTKRVIGDGPERRRLQAEFPTARFVGYRFGAELAAHLAAADVFVFPSRTDTFGLVLLEALAALKLDPTRCRAFALKHTWEAATHQFVANLAPRGETFSSRDKAESITTHVAL